MLSGLQVTREISGQDLVPVIDDAGTIVHDSTARLIQEPGFPVTLYTAEEGAAIDGKLVRVVSWYDNEWGFSNRMVDTAGAMAKLI